MARSLVKSASLRTAPNNAVSKQVTKPKGRAAAPRLIATNENVKRSAAKSTTHSAAALPVARFHQGVPPEPIIVPLSRLRPTQVAVGMRAVAAKREKVQRHAQKTKKIESFLENRPIPAVFGPGGSLYIVDHHHLTLALLQSRVARAFVEVIDDLSALSYQRFWEVMVKRGCAYPYDETGRKIAPIRIPQTLMALRDDPFRDLAWSVRECGAYKKQSAPYSEFRWAEFFRAQISERLVRQNYQLAVDMAVRLARSPAAVALPGYCGTQSR